jgi:tetratricopeptide (TPR) repeat protein
MTKILRTYLKVWLFLLPIFFLPVVVDSFGFGKNWLMFLVMFLGLIIWAVSMAVKKDNKIYFGKGFGWLLVLTVWAAVFWYFGEVGVRMRAWMGIPGLGMLLSMTIWAFLWMQVAEDRDGSEEKWLTVAGLLTAITSLIVFLIPASKMPISWPKGNPIVNLTADWSLTGSVLGEIWMLAILGIIWTKKLLEKIKKREGYVGEMTITAVLVLVLFLDVFKTVRAGWGYLDINSSWTIASESLKFKPLQGIGIGNYLEAFNKWRPIAFNLTKNWTGSFGWSANGGLQLWTELGLVGLAMGLLAMIGFMKAQKSKAAKIWVLVGTLALLLTPINFVSLVLIVWLVTKDIKTKEIKPMLKVGESGMNGAPIILAVLLVAGSIYGLFWWTKILLGEIYLKNSLVSAAANDGGGTYNWQIKAITANPYDAEYRRIYSQTNLVLATGMMSNGEITDEQKQKVAVLIQQSAREGKAAIALDNANSKYWSNLAGIYRQLIGSVDGSADWSYQAYVQALGLDPIDPSLRLDFGGLLFAAGRYEEADRLFEQVVTLKSDLPNGWYNWAYSAKKLNKLPEAVARLSQAVSLVPVTSGDYDMASKELETWKKEYDALLKKQADATKEATKQAETLKVPSALPTGTNPAVTVPTDGLEPPATTQVTPSPTQ